MRQKDQTKDKLLREITSLRGRISDLEESEKQREQLAREIALVDQISLILVSTLNINEVYAEFAIAVKRLIDFDMLLIHSIDQQAGTFTLHYRYGIERPGSEVGSIEPLAGTLTQQVVSTGRTIVQEDLAANPQFIWDQEFIQMGIRSAIRIPLFVKGQVIGAMGLRSHQPNAFGPREQAILERLADQIAPAVENADQHEQLQAEMALVDGPNIHRTGGWLLGPHPAPSAS